MEPHGFLSGKCKHGSSNFCSLCDIEGNPERYTEKLLNEVVIEITENTKQPLSGRLQSRLMAYKLASSMKDIWNETVGEVIREPFYRPTQRAADVCHECGATETIDPNNDGVPICVECGTRR